LPGIDARRVESDETTQIRNVYTPEGRKQWVLHRAASIKASYLPDEWCSSSIVLLGPVAGEVDADLANSLKGSMIGVGIQGWLRAIGSDGSVSAIPLINGFRGAPCAR
jgi:hypothetical protein